MANEKRLIDANALHQRIAFAEIDTLQDRLLFTEMIHNALTVDAVEVVHGRWIERKLDDFRMWELKCSECGWIGISNYDAYDEPYDFNYCPNCGADMRDGDGNV